MNNKEGVGGVPWRNILGQHRTSHFYRERAGTNEVFFESDSRPETANPRRDSNVKTKGAGKEPGPGPEVGPQTLPLPTLTLGLRTAALTTTSSKMLCSCVSIVTIEPRAPGVPGEARVSP